MRGRLRPIGVEIERAPHRSQRSHQGRRDCERLRLPDRKGQTNEFGALAKRHRDRV